MDAHTLKILLVARAQLVSQRQMVANTVRGLLKTFGLVIARGAQRLFPIRVREQLAGNDVLAAIVEPMLVVWHALREQIDTLDRQILARARRLMAPVSSTSASASAAAARAGSLLSRISVRTSAVMNSMIGVACEAASVPRNSAFIGCSSSSGDGSGSNYPATQVPSNRPRNFAP